MTGRPGWYFQLLYPHGRYVLRDVLCPWHTAGYDLQATQDNPQALNDLLAPGKDSVFHSGRICAASDGGPHL